MRAGGVEGKRQPWIKISMNKGKLVDARHNLEACILFHPHGVLKFFLS